MNIPAAIIARAAELSGEYSSRTSRAHNHRVDIEVLPYDLYTVAFRTGQGGGVVQRRYILDLAGNVLRSSR